MLSLISLDGWISPDLSMGVFEYRAWHWTAKLAAARSRMSAVT